MCLEVVAQIAPDAKARISAQRLSDLCGLRVSKVRFEGKPALHFSVFGGCSCDFLPEGAEWEPPTWTLDPTHLPALEKAIVVLGGECRRFSFVVHWLNGDRLRETRQINLKDLISHVHQNTIGNNVVYIVN